MGTVGLSFGSPTSGTGFDVSTTVSEIVSNLQNVETPWKTQLTSLESQDTAISSLGTLFSNLSNDLSNLTDFQGILAQKTGSSSNTNVLELTAASSSATAGTHTVVVNSLAQTSSGYLAEISSSSAALSGSITLAVGSGTAETFTMGAEPSTGPASNTTYTGSGADTLSDLASSINSSGLGITANVENDSTGSWLSLTSGTSGAGGNIAVSSNTLAGTGQILSYSGTAGIDASGSTAATTSTGTLPAVGSSDVLQGSISIQTGSGTPISVTMSQVESTTGGSTMGDLATYLQDNYSSQLTAAAVTNSDGSVSLTLRSLTSGSAGTLTVNSSLIDTNSSTLGYTSAVTGADANLTIDGKPNIQSSSNTVSNLIPGLTFQLLSASPDAIQVVIANDNSGVESTMAQMVSDYNSLISAVNTQEGNTSSGTAEPLFGSPTLSLLQQQLLSGLNLQNPNGYMDAISSTSTTTLSGSLTLQVGSNTAQTIQIGAAPSSPAPNTIYTGSGVNTLAGLVAAINSANIGVTAAVTTSQGESTLTFTSQTEGTSGALTVTSGLSTVTPTALTYSDTGGYTDATPDSGNLGAVASATDTLSGSLTIQVGGGNAQTVTLDSSNDTLSGLMTAINGLSGVSAALNEAGTGLTLTSTSDGAAGALTVTSNLADTTNPTTTALNYNTSSDIGSLTALGVSVNNDGTLTFDADSLDSVLNTDFSSVSGFFQNANSWGQTFSNMLTNAGTGSATGILSLASSSNSNIESTLNAEISKEQSYISAQQTSLTAELNSANEIMQQLPTELQGVNELYSAISGYNENSNG
jgi:flagellar hook-associated protein 2